MEKKKTIEFNFFTFLIILVVLLGIVFFVARQTGGKQTDKNTQNQQEEQNNNVENTETKLYSNNAIILDESKLTDKWKIVEDSYGSIIFYIQGPEKEEEDGTYHDVRINVYVEKSDFSNNDLKNQMLENSIYDEIKYNKETKINDIRWMEFLGTQENTRAKILTIMKDGYMYAVEIVGEENLYKENQESAMEIINTIKIADRIPEEQVSDVVYKYYNLANIKQGSTRYLLTSLNLNATEEQKEVTLPVEYQDYVWTGIKYSDFENEMKKYMTEEVIKSQFPEYIEFEGNLYIKEQTGTEQDFVIENIVEKSIKGYEITYEVTRTDMNLFMTLKQNITIKIDGDKYVVSNVADVE